MVDEGTRRCPRCGRGELVDTSFDEGVPSEIKGVGEGPEDAPAQLAGTRQVETYSCGHEVIGPSLAGADETELDVERRTSDETTDPTPSASRRANRAGDAPELREPGHGASPPAGS